jgi:hypothetical protein
MRITLCPVVAPRSGVALAAGLMVALTAAPAAPQAATDADTAERAPFVGCASDGQMGPQPPPDDQGEAPPLPPPLARRLAYYKSQDLDVLAPRGWHCLGLYGATGAALLVTPQAYRPGDLLKPEFRIKGPAVQLSVSYGDTAGRFEAALVAARLFPTKQDYVQAVIGEGVVPAADFKLGPYPADILIRRDDADVEFITPANQAGMGTRGRLARAAGPIKGVAIMTNNNDLVTLAARLPADQDDLLPVMIAQTRMVATE